VSLFIEAHREGPTNAAIRRTYVPFTSCTYRRFPASASWRRVTADVVVGNDTGSDVPLALCGSTAFGERDVEGER
jgi:hypothetical protein